MKIHPEFPPHRRRDPKRRSEGLVYDLLQSDILGQALYEQKATPEAPGLDFAIWVQDRARFGLQVKGGL